MRKLHREMKALPEFSHCLYILCDSHGLQLLVKDIVESKRWMPVLGKANFLINFFKKAKLQLARLRAHQRDCYIRHKAFITAAITRWGTQLAAVKSVFDNKEALRAFARDPAVLNGTKRTLMKEEDHDTQSSLDQVISYINDIEFWTNLEMLFKILHPIGAAQASSERDRANLSEVIPHTAKRRFELQIDDIHYMAFALDPATTDPKHKMLTTEIVGRAHRFLEATACKEEYGRMFREFCQFRAREGSLFCPGSHMYKAATESTPRGQHILDCWRYLHSMDVSLAALAKRILGALANSVPSERSFSSTNYLHSRIRNRLAVASTNMLTFIYMNSRVLRRLEAAQETLLKSTNGPSWETADLETLLKLEDDFQDCIVVATSIRARVGRDVELRCLQQADIVGVTTTGLARNLDLLRRLHCKVMLCEEAGEVLEAHILTALLPSLQHAILIGDHLQLRPQIQNYELQSSNPRGAQYSLDMSLFERLVQPVRPSDAHIPFSVLDTQRRMHPDISELVRATLYPSLLDSESVRHYPQDVGMRDRLFWFHHEQLEAAAANLDPLNKSHVNEFEVEMTTALVSHLVRQGEYSQGDIAVITPYLGQLHRLRRRMESMFEICLNDRDTEDLVNLETGDAIARAPFRPLVQKSSLLKSIRVATVDNFQGEEAKVIIISIVRSNPQQRCGFLSTSNRINVLLSRAKHGMYIIGNANTCKNVSMCVLAIQTLQSPYPIPIIFFNFLPRAAAIFHVTSGFAAVIRAWANAIRTSFTMQSNASRDVQGPSKAASIPARYLAETPVKRSALSVWTALISLSHVVTDFQRQSAGKLRILHP
ncbi:hypothetical protein HIM_12270 [Hirsutella minnesotensis 3608]|uniref:DNA2/NAM7 helicase-like C-terminal domain-containing protein n=1 Tax=Hirsutella minnesotensis 3608 TaxID=1043627 RepID=A0A0F7ZW46_9HYPO|nr:hypothetical protein HIM_12270 [Hirsutella minnesotensis 3608]